MTSQSQHPAPALPPSGWIRRFSSLIPPGSRVIDVACGRGRHGRLFLDSGCDVTFIDRDPSGVADLTGRATVIAHDLELPGDGPGMSWPFPPGAFDAVIVTNYLHRPLFPALIEAVSPGGILLYETFAQGNEHFGRPRNPDHLLRAGELLERTYPLQVIAYETGTVCRNGENRVISRIAAIRGETPVLLPLAEPCD